MNNLLPDGQSTIGALAQLTGLNVSAIRYFEEVGLIPPAARRPSGHRIYDQQAEEMLTLVRQCRDMGFSIGETRALVSLSSSPQQNCTEARTIAQAHLAAVQTKLTELRTLERSLSQFVQTCTDQCVGGPAPKCTIFKDIGTNNAGPVPGRCCGEVRLS